MSRLLIALVLICAVLVPSAAAATPKGFAVIATQTASKGSARSITFKESLVSGKKVIGHDLVTCKPVDKKSLHCAATFTFSRGTIKVSGSILYAKSANTLAITGGTKAYAGAKGKLVLTELTAKTTAQVFSFS